MRIFETRFWKQDAASRDQKLALLIAAAAQTEYYRDRVPGHRWKDEAALSRIEPATLRAFEERPDQFRNPQFTGQGLPPFRYPIDPAPYLTIVQEATQRAARTDWIRSCAPAELDQLRERGLAAPLGLWRELAAAPVPLRYPIVAFSGLRHGAMTQEDRDLFWDAFRVPVFEQFLGLAGEVLAEECQAHTGLHVRTEDTVVETASGEMILTSLLNLKYPLLRLATGMLAEADSSLCGCGKPGMRLTRVAARPAAMFAAAGS
ncbi:MAG: hypothetical protein ACRD7E_30485 [Bryobacteraceae bacterium]